MILQVAQISQPLHLFPGLSGTIAAAVADHLWQSTVFAALAALLTLALRKNHARVRYWLWFAASAKFLLPFSLLVMLGSHLAWLRPAPKQTSDANAATYQVMEEVSQPFELADFAPMPPAPVPSRVARIRAALGGSFVPASLAAIWLAGALFVVGRWTKRWWRIAVVIRLAPPLTEGREAETLRRMERAAGLRQSIALKLLPISIEPGIFGLFRPVLLWPEAISDRLSDAQLEAVVTHEVCHVRRRDNITAALHMAVEAIFWFHPLVWWLETRLVEERETACDQDVLALCGPTSVNVRAYAESILKVCEFCVESPLACVAGVTGADLRRRVAGIVTGRALLRMTWPKKILIAAAAVCAVAVPVMLGQARAAHRLMLAAIHSAPKPFQSVAHAMIVEQQTPSSNEIAQPSANVTPQTITDTPNSGPGFEVAVIRPADDNDGRHWWGFRVDPAGRLTVSAVPLKGLVGFSSIHSPGNGQVSGGPSWTESQKWDITAKADPSKIPDWDQLSDEERMDRIKPMLLKLVIERFHVKLHTETRTYSVYAMVPTKGGVKLGEAFKKAAPPPAHVDQQEMEKQARGNKLPMGGYTMGPDGSWLFLSVEPYILASQIAANCRIVGMVVDQSGLRGHYDLTFKPDRGPDAPPLQDQVEAQLGLRFEPKKVPLPTYVIDSAEKPSVDGAEMQPPSAASSATGVAAPPIKFDVVSIKRSRPGETGHFGFTPTGFSAAAMPVGQLIYQAFYGGKIPGGNPVSGFPDWIAERWDIEAKVAPEDADAFQKHIPRLTDPPDSLGCQLLQSILTDRFHLVVHRAPVEINGYMLLVAKNGPKLKKAAPEESRPAGATPDPDGGYLDMHRNEDFPRITYYSFTMAAFAARLRGLGAVVVDRTGLAGTYDFTLNWRSAGQDEEHPGAMYPNDPDPLSHWDIGALGLRTERIKVPAEYIVIDHIDRPSEN